MNPSIVLRPIHSRPTGEGAQVFYQLYCLLISARNRHLSYYPRRLCCSAWVGRSRPSVCLFVRSITQKRMIPKCSNLVSGMFLGYTTEVTWFWDWKVKGQGHRVSNTTQWHFISNSNYDRASFTFARWRYWQEQYGVGSHYILVHFCRSVVWYCNGYSRTHLGSNQPLWY